MVTNAKPKVGGAVSIAPTGTTLPTDATTALDAAFKNLGAISEDGFVNMITRDSTDIKAWGGATALNAQTGFDNKYKATFIDSTDLEVLKAVYGSANVTGTLATGIDVKINETELSEVSMAVDMILKGGTVERIVIARAKIIEVGDIVYKDNEAVAYEVTIATYQDSSGNFAHNYMYKS